MSNTTLSHALLDLGFLSVLATEERDARKPGSQAGKTHVRCGPPLVWNTHNDVVVVYDGSGMPWIRLWDRRADGLQGSAEEIHGMLEGFLIPRDPAAHVPHSTDPKHGFLLDIMPALRTPIPLPIAIA